MWWLTALLADLQTKMGRPFRCAHFQMSHELHAGAVQNTSHTILLDYLRLLKLDCRIDPEWAALDAKPCSHMFNCNLILRLVQTCWWNLARRRPSSHWYNVIHAYYQLVRLKMIICVGLSDWVMSDFNKRGCDDTLDGLLQSAKHYRARGRRYIKGMHTWKQRLQQF